MLLEEPTQTDLAPKSFFGVRQGDARQMDVLFSQAFLTPLVTCTITSPPYGDLKNYGHRDQIGWGQSFDEYLVEMRRVFRSVHRHTKDDGSMWVIADTLRPREQNGSIWRMEPLPFQLAQEARDAGWMLRDIIIWEKDKTLPWSGRGRLRNGFEYVLLFVKSEKFKFHIDRVRDRVRLEQWWVKWPERYNPLGKVPTNVWRIPIPVQGAWKNTDVEHMCPLPPDLVERLILLSTDPGDVVFDPFAGTGVVVAEAERLKRRGLGIELVERHVRAYTKTTLPEIMERNKKDELAQRLARAKHLQDVIPKLRLVKFPRVLLHRVVSTHPNLPKPRMAIALLQRGFQPGVLIEPYKVIEARVVFAIKETGPRREQLRQRLTEATQVVPASKFGISGEIDVVGLDEVAKAIRGKGKMFLYTDGHTWMSDGYITPMRIKKLLDAKPEGKWPPIVSNVLVQEKPRALVETVKEKPHSH
jgi:DNA modification methylase